MTDLSSISAQLHHILALVQTHVPLIIVCGMLLAVLFWRTAHRKMRSRYRAADARMLSFLELATHQLGAPIASIKWWVDILKDPATKGDAKKEAFDQIADAVNRIDAITKALNDARAVDVGSMEYDAGVLYSFDFIAKKVVDDAKRLLSARFQKVIINVEKSIPPVALDPTLVIGALGEVLDNAIHYSPPKAVIELNIRKGRKQAIIEMIDHGDGIPGNEMSQVFRKFFRGSKAQQSKPVGNGLGLFTAKGIIERGGGTIRLDSEEGQGTKVTLTVPYERNVKPVDDATREKKVRNMAFK